MSITLRGIFLCLGLLAGLTAGAAEPLKGYNVKPGETTVSGLSSGAFMAHQLHIAHSDIIQGAGIFAGGPYYCADGSQTRAMGRCTCFSRSEIGKMFPGATVCDKPQAGFDPPKASEALAKAKSHAGKKLIAPLSNLADDKVFLMLGDKDAVVLPQSMQAVAGFYQDVGLKPEQIKSAPLNGNHTFPTLTEGKACGVLESPYIGKCGLDGVGEMLAHLLGPLQPRVDQPAGTLVAFDQREFTPKKDAKAISMADTGYIYVPPACAAGQSCRVHVALHGCGQSVEALKGTLYPEATGYREWADNNNLVILFPQTVARYDWMGGQLNPMSCWDWWGYVQPAGTTGHDLYGTRKGPQVAALRAIIDRVTAGK